MIPLPCNPWAVGEPQEFASSAAWLAAQIWEAMDRDQKNQILWDIEPEEKFRSLLRCLANSPLVCFAMADDQPKGVAWLTPTCAGSKTFACHFAFAGPGSMAQRMAAGAAFLRLAAQMGELLIALFPRPWRGARSFAESLGFLETLTLPGACHIARHNRNVPGILMTWHKLKAANANITIEEHLDEGLPLAVVKFPEGKFCRP